MTTVIMRTTARAIVPIVLVVAISLFIEGHNLPGGGFIGWRAHDDGVRDHLHGLWP
ncbi:MnhB subunit of Na+/H+ antiporter-like protein [Natrinema hispanicum]|uniref:MnhB subunit of Na+/H+ antiporter-like protein n=1 Tax=Natrinema hispanicum TaxID=392421 RepID=A0A482YDA0_9EURY|nr:MnhB subunit of Na+/H+ antiporter-like protein [Natrinema hispanicum]